MSFQIYKKKEHAHTVKKVKNHYRKKQYNVTLINKQNDYEIVLKTKCI